MKRFHFQKLDAFQNGNSTGNPAGLVLLNPDDDISEHDMQRIAGELKGFVSEVGYVRFLKPGEVSLRYFSCEREVPFCGHATVAILHRLITIFPDLREREELLIRTRFDELTVINKVATENLVYIHAPQATVLTARITLKDIAEAMNLVPEALGCFSTASTAGGGAKDPPGRACLRKALR